MYIWTLRALMPRYVKIIVGLLFAINLYGQEKCDVSKMSQQDKSILEKFWVNLKIALNAKDKVKLSTLINFPFNCDYCIIDSLHLSDEPFIKVAKKQFDTKQFKIFFEKKLVDYVNKYQLPKDISILTTHYNTVDKKCSFSFRYIAITENKQHPGRTEWFDIEKLNGEFKITSTWTLP
jgi:hypothetical protein